MALQITYTDKYGGLHAEAYIRITQIKLDYAESVAVLTVCTYKDKAARDSNKEHFVLIHQMVINSDTEPNFTDNFATSILDVVNSNPLQSAYIYLKTLAEYSSAIDV